MGRPLNKKLFLVGTTTTSTTLLLHSKLGSGVYNSGIIKQSGSKKFKVWQQGRNAEGVAFLVPTTELEPNQAYMTATDQSGATYFVSKITGKLVTIVRHLGAEDSGAPTSPPTSGWIFLTGDSVPWTTDNNPPSGYVKIEVF